MLWLPPVSAEVVNVAVLPLLLRLMVPVPRVVVPSMKVTLPVASPGTVAVKVTGSPYQQVLAELVRLVVKFALFTGWLMVWLVLPA